MHFDHTAPIFSDADRDGDDDPPGEADADDFCFTTSDDTMMRRRHKQSYKDTGPGIITAGTNTLTFTVEVDDLNPLLVLGDWVYIWADTQHKRIVDRAPNTESGNGNGCSKPEVSSEVLELQLTAPPT